MNVAKMVRKRLSKLMRILAVCTTVFHSTASNAVERDSLSGKVFCGYQGWFRAEGDPSGLGWVHFGPGKKLAPGMCSFDLWPDLSEFSSGERYPSPFRFADGSTAELFSSVNPLSVNRHFRWMREYGIDGAFLQRFATTLESPKSRESMNVVLKNCTQSAASEGRSLIVMYDLSGLAPEKFPVVADDWKALVAAGQTRGDGVQKVHGKPLVALWGLGFKDRPAALAEWRCLISEIKATGCAVMLGVPTFWRDLKGDSITDVALHELIREADVLSPWTVGRYSNPDQVETFAREVWRKDQIWCAAAEIVYLPVIFPGFSWHNLSLMRGNDSPLNKIPRLGGRFFWRQAVEAKKAGADALYVAMFDEIDEGTAVMKCGGPVPIGASPFVDLSDVPTDHYLWLCGQAARMLSGEVAPDQIPPVR